MNRSLPHAISVPPLNFPVLVLRAMFLGVVFDLAAKATMVLMSPTIYQFIEEVAPVLAFAVASATTECAPLLSNAGHNFSNLDPVPGPLGKAQHRHVSRVEVVALCCAPSAS